uniref:C-type lectin domain-containing protein n=1 Tax=Chrysemys picta bellii TaxID=8478 RepID=A0A8C3FNK5_CHRPI
MQSVPLKVSSSAYSELNASFGKKLSEESGKFSLMYFPSAGPPEPPSSMRGPSGKDGLRGPQGPRGEKEQSVHLILWGWQFLAMDGTIKTFGKKMFATNGQEVDFETTLEACKQAGGSIASPRNKGENDAVFSIVRLFNRYAYLGIKGGGIPGKFSFLDGTAVNYTNWHAGEPSDIGKENCMEMCTNGAWNGTSCNQYRLTICEF